MPFEVRHRGGAKRSLYGTFTESGLVSLKTRSPSDPLSSSTHQTLLADCLLAKCGMAATAVHIAWPFTTWL